MAPAWALALLAALAWPAGAWRSEGELSIERLFRSYVGKFCFDYAPPLPSGAEPPVGTFEVRATGHVEELPPPEVLPSRCYEKCETPGRFFLMVFDDEAGRWQSARADWEQWSCEDLHHKSSIALDLTDGLQSESHSYTQRVSVHEGIRPRFWYFAFVNCGAKVVSPVSYSLHAVNVNQGFQAEFGFDVRGTLPVEVGFGALFVAVALAAIKVTWAGGAREEASRWRPLLGLLQASAGCSALGCGCLALHHGIYACDGKGLALASLLGTLCTCAAKALLMALQFLVAKGWALFQVEAEQRNRHGMVVALASIAALSIGVEMHGEYFHDESTSMYLYQSWPGHLILALNSVLLATSWALLWNTYKRETSEEVRTFYRWISLACGLYFASLPVVCLLAELISPRWRRRTVEVAELGARSAATALLLLRLRPSRLTILVALRLGSAAKGLAQEAELEEAVEERRRLAGGDDGSAGE